MIFEINRMFPNATDEQKWEQFRLWRSIELSRTDWTQLEDAPADKAAWAIYRQALRDLPETVVDVFNPIWPSKPE